ncbi:hypothetical protein L1049_017442 [Liquidambar formosana]|uniref:SWIM-type domain-containing protein n=1 Tax=Liquidambar formosana TaxID=63359 RepID=A0AAP0X3Q4_LIQFO
MASLFLEAGYAQRREFDYRSTYNDQIDNSEAKSITRCGCLAAFRIAYKQKLNVWVVKKFNAEHNHELVPISEVQFLRSHRAMSGADKAQADAMRKVGIRTCHVIDHMQSQSGGYQNIGFTPKDLYNYVDGQRRKQIVDGDAMGCLAYLTAKADSDHGFFHKYTVDEQNRLTQLFFADSKSRLDYACFGDVLAFDATYSTNVYKKPFVILIGVNNHFQTIIFGCALLADETVGTYKWVLTSLLEAMDNKKPISVITDGDKAMRKAIKQIFPEARHRLCAWHLQRNASANVHNKNFHKDFKRLMFNECSIEEFETDWQSVIEKYELDGNKWIEDIYDDRFRWAAAHLRGQFFAGMRSTQRNEGMNAFFNEHLTPRLQLFEFVQHYDRALVKLRHAETQAEYDSNHTSPVTNSALVSIESHAIRIFTKKMFSKFREELKYETLYFVRHTEDHGDQRIHILSQHSSPEAAITVVHYRDEEKMKCSCLTFETIGLPCRHIIAVMKVERLQEIPTNCILKRWTKLARGGIYCTFSTEVSNDETEQMRYSALSASCNEMCYLASKCSEGFHEARNEVAKLTYRMEQLCAMYRRGGTDAGVCEGGPRRRPMVQDPDIARTKGNTRSMPTSMPKARRCSHCKFEGHDIRRCPLLGKGSTCEDSNIGSDIHAEGSGFEQPNLYAYKSFSQSHSMHHHSSIPSTQADWSCDSMRAVSYSCDAHIVQEKDNTFDGASQVTEHNLY